MVVVVAQPVYLRCAHVSSVTEPKSHSSLPKHLPLHTEESAEKVHPATNFTNQRYHWSSRCYARKTDRKGKDALGGSWLLQSVAPLRSTILILDELDRVA